MAGLMCSELEVRKYDPRLSSCYCEGRKANKDAYPGAYTNPYPDPSPERSAFTRGADSWNNPAGVDSPIDCCADRGNTAA